MNLPIPEGPMEAIYFTSPEELREWYIAHHDKATALVIGFYKKHTGSPSLTYREALDAALCFGWIDGIRRRVDDDRYTNRYTPRQKRSIWSDVNIKRIGELTELERMHPAGLKAFEERDPARTKQYSNEQANVQFDPAYEAEFKANPQAWDFFQSQPPSYRKPATWWVISAKKEETRRRRLATLIADSAAGRRVAPLTPAGKWS
jgi:uncharacterized protein YdeI (YjbR/CyaY-like superfamily)